MPKTLLLADDSVVIQKLAALSFANEDIDLVTVYNGDDAIEQTRSIVPNLVLADVVMPGKNGYEVCAEIKADPQLRHIPVLLLTGTFEAFDEDRAQQAGASGHITKPFESQALVDRVKELLGDTPEAAAETAPSPDQTFSFFEEALEASLSEMEPEPTSPPGPASPDDVGAEGVGERTVALLPGDPEPTAETREGAISETAALDGISSPGFVSVPDLGPAQELDGGRPEVQAAETSAAPEVSEDLFLSPPLADDGALPAGVDLEPTASDEPLGVLEPPLDLDLDLDLDPDDLDPLPEADLDPAGSSAFDVSTSDLADSFAGLDAPEPAEPDIESTGSTQPTAFPEPESVAVPVPEEPTTQPPELSPILRQRIHETLEKVAWEAFADLSDVIVRQVVERVERIAWEVVPQMAETLIQEEIRKIKDAPED